MSDPKKTESPGDTPTDAHTKTSASGRARVTGLVVTIGLLIALVVTSVLFYKQSYTPPKQHGDIVIVPREPIDQNTLVGSPAPDVTLKTMTGQEISLSSLKGKTVILNFWATWCPPCVTEFPTLIDIAQKYNDRVVVIALSSDKQRGTVAAFLTAQEDSLGQPLAEISNFVVGLDETRAVTRDIFRVTTYPESYIIGPDGIIARHIIGIDDWINPDVIRLMETAPIR